MIYLEKIPSFLICILLFSFLSCSESQPQGPEIDWNSGTTWTYSYSGGVLSGINVYVKFVVVGESGDLRIDASLGGDELSKTTYVNKGEEYSVKAECKISNGGGKLLKIDSPTAPSPISYSISGYTMKLENLSVYQ